MHLCFLEIPLFRMPLFLKYCQITFITGHDLEKFQYFIHMANFCRIIKPPVQVFDLVGFSCRTAMKVRFKNRIKIVCAYYKWISDACQSFWLLYVEKLEISKRAQKLLKNEKDNEVKIICKLWALKSKKSKV